MEVLSIKIRDKSAVMQSETTIVWFRQDLRLKDNPALSFAAEHGNIIPLYIHDETCREANGIGGASKWWLHHSLLSLAENLQENLIITRGKPLQILQEVIRITGATRVVWNRCYEPYARERDSEIKHKLKESGIGVISFNGSLLWEPMTVLKKDQTPYKVFTPYYRKGCLAAQQPRYPLTRPTLVFAEHSHPVGDVSDLNLLPQIQWDSEFYQHWSPGEMGASDKLQAFIKAAAIDYQAQRNIPSKPGTSRLSAHLHFGEISPNQAWYAVLDAFGGSEDNNIDTYLNELGWREFNYYLLYHWPNIDQCNFNSKFDAFPWRKDQESLHAWQKGETGIPIVDAGMRELWQTGYMHNRVRMVVASFLVKNLLIDWRAGAAWFSDCLVDADLASNSGGWQWAAGSGADAAPYFRVFNPILQGEKFDKHGDYVKQYCPELARLPDKYIHKPWEAPHNVLHNAGIVLGKDYPSPIVDLKSSRQRALDAYQQIKGAV